MFGCVVASRPLQTDLKQIDETHAYFDIFNASSVNHISVFMLGTGPSVLALILDVLGLTRSSPLVPFPPDYGATVHFFYPGKGFQLLGMCVISSPPLFYPDLVVSLNHVPSQAIQRQTLGHLQASWYIYR
jgi:hypothetical protein